MNLHGRCFYIKTCVIVEMVKFSLRTRSFNISGRRESPVSAFIAAITQTITGTNLFSQTLYNVKSYCKWKKVNNLKREHVCEAVGGQT